MDGGGMPDSIEEQRADDPSNWSNVDTNFKKDITQVIEMLIPTCLKPLSDLYPS